jgi:hypothetical protein
LRRLNPLKLLSAVAEVTGRSRNNSSIFTTALNMAICWPSLRRHAITVSVVTGKGNTPLDSATASDVCDYSLVFLHTLPDEKFSHTPKLVVPTPL